MRNHTVPAGKASFPLVLPIVLLGLYLLSIPAHDARMRSRSISPAQAPEVAVQSQRNAPLLISKVSSEFATPTTPHLGLMIMNVSAKPIIAYAIRYEAIAGRSRTKGVELSVAASPRSILQPGQSTQTDVGGGENHADDINKFVISVDFVEFENGSTWGPDTNNSAERLAGRRAGARATAKHLLQVLSTKGPGAVLEAVETDPLDAHKAVDASEQWLEGFRAGIGYIQARAKQAYNDGGVSSIETALRQPVDASDRRKVQ